MAGVAVYLENWAEIALAIKQAAGYQCSCCDCQCLPATASYRHLDRSLRRALSAQVHHLDGNPGNNRARNLVSLCASCHLRMHRHRIKTDPEQLALKLKLSASRHVHRGRACGQLASNDLIDRLPRLEQGFSHQIELEL